MSEHGEVGTVDALIRALPQYSPTLFAKLSAADFVSHLQATYVRQFPKTWQWRASTSERDICRPDGARVASRVSTIIHFFGWKGGNYHKIIDPITMYGHSLDRVWPGDDGHLARLLHWTVALRNFCEENGLEIRPTIGAVSAQFLTDRRFYPRARRKVPAKINQRVREQLPGNHYVLNVMPTPEREFTAQYLDQHRAHHYHARTIQFPDSNQLYAHGRFTDLDGIAFDNVTPDFYGLYCLDLEMPRHHRRSHWVRQTKRQFVFSNELQHLLDDGYRIIGVRAAWGSHQQDVGLRAYAQWADSQLDHYGDKPWLKPLLLATYGTLATRPTAGEAVFRLAKRGESVTLTTGHRKLTGRLAKRSQKLEPRIANVIHRGMIEAATRSESVGLAQHLSFRGHRILSIYADAVIVKDDPDKPLPPLLEPWRLKQTLNHLQFINQQAFISGEMTKLPGISRELREYRPETKPGYAPRKIAYEAITGKPILTDRRI